MYLDIRPLKYLSCAGLIPCSLFFVLKWVSMDIQKLPFSKFIVKNGFIFTSGQVHLNHDGTRLEGSIEDKSHRVMKNLESVLKEAGISFKDVIKTTIYVTDMSEYAKINEVYASYMSEPYPARESVCVKELPLGADIEISMIAAKP